jgi:hypothetical protein
VAELEAAKLAKERDPKNFVLPPGRKYCGEEQTQSEMHTLLQFSVTPLTKHSLITNPIRQYQFLFRLAQRRMLFCLVHLGSS